MIQWQRWQGTLELGVGAPPSTGARLPAVLARELVHRRCTRSRRRSSGAASSSACRSTSRTRGCSCSRCPTTVISLGLIGLLLASTFVLYRNANAMSNLLEYPVWIASGLVFSTSILPAWTRPISWVLPPYWGIIALRHAAFGGEVWVPLAMVLALGVDLGRDRDVHVLRWFEHLARARATLVADMKRWLRIFFVGGLIAYRGALQLDPPGDVHPDDAREPALPADLLHEARPVRARRERATSTSSATRCRSARCRRCTA